MQAAQPTGLYLQELEGAALFKLLEHVFEVSERTPSTLHVCPIALPSEEATGGIFKVGLEGEETLHTTSNQKIVRVEEDVNCNNMGVKRNSRMLHWHSGLASG